MATRTLSGLVDRLARQRGLLSREALASENAPLLGIAGASFLAHLLVAGNYGYFRDELYYIAAGRHPALGYVDFPPMIAFLAILLNVVGDSLVAIHVVSALAAACLIFVAGLMARALGGGRFAQALAALGTAVALVFMATGSIFSMDVLDELWWALAAYVFIGIVKHPERPRLWLLFGLVAGLGLFTKLTMLFFGFAFVVGLLATPARTYFRSRELWLGGAIAFAFLLPYLFWNAANGWPTPEFWTHYGGLTGGGPLDFVANQLFIMNPLTIPLWVAGLYFYLRTEAGRPYRALGWAYVALVVFFLLLGVKPYFLAPSYTMLLAAGAVQLEQAGLLRRRAWLKPVYVAALALSGLLLAPLAMPMLPPATFVRAYGFLTGAGNAGAGQQTQGPFPQYLGDRFGWEQMAATVARVYRSLPAEQRAKACVFTANYGEASALALYQKQYFLPPTVSGHNNYHLWGPGYCSGAVVITVGLSLADDQQTFAHIVRAVTIYCTYCLPEENDVTCSSPYTRSRTVSASGAARKDERLRRSRASVPDSGSEMVRAARGV